MTKKFSEIVAATFTPEEQQEIHEEVQKIIQEQKTLLQAAQPPTPNSSAQLPKPENLKPASVKRKGKRENPIVVAHRGQRTLLPKQPE